MIVDKPGPLSKTKNLFHGRLNKFSSVPHFFRQAHSFIPHRKNANPSTKTAGADPPRQNDQGPLMPTTKVKESPQRFAFPGGAVHPAFPGDDHIRLFNVLFQTHETKNGLRASFETRIGKSKETRRGPPCGPGSWNFRNFFSRRFRQARQSFETPFKPNHV